jgi:ribonuclease P protein component
LEFSFSKKEKLCSRKAIESLLKDGKSLFCYPYKVLWVKTEYEQPFSAQVAFSVPKRKHKCANKRNTIKRRMREAFRLHKESIYSVLLEKNSKIQLLFVYIATEELTYQEIESKLKNVLDQIIKNIQSTDI